jgi:hypothetical protein
MILSSTFICICVCQLKAMPSVVILTDNYSTVALGLVNPSVSYLYKFPILKAHLT